MVYLDVLYALIISILISVVFVYGFRREGPWQGFFIFFLIIFLAAWAGGIWLAPTRTSIRGMYWLPFLMVGLIFALLLAAATPPKPEPSIILKTKKEAKKEEVIKTALSIFFWVLIIALIVAIVVGYWFYPASLAVV